MKRRTKRVIGFGVVLSLIAGIVVFFQVAGTALRDYAAAQCNPALALAQMLGQAPLTPATSSSPPISSVSLNPSGTYVSAAKTTLDFSNFVSLTGFKWKAKERQANLQEVDGVALARGLTVRERKLNLGVVLQESGGLNLPGGDRDSLGLYQQRPSAGWGTPSQIKNRDYAANKFIDAMKKKTTKKQRATLPLVELGIMIQIPNKYYYHRDWRWDKVVDSLLSKETGPNPYANGDAPQTLLDDQFNFGQDGDCSTSCVGNFTSVDSLAVVSSNTLYTNSKSNVVAGVKKLAASADIIGLQEMSYKTNRDAVRKATEGQFGMTKDANPIPILWRTSKLTLLDKHSAQTISATHVENGASGHRLGDRDVNWVKLKVKATGSVIYVINNHIVPTIDRGGAPDKSKPLRLRLYNQQMDALKELISNFSQEGPVFVTGDFNIDAKGDSEKKDPGFLYAAMTKLHMVSNYGTLGFPKTSTHEGGRYIDYVWSLKSKAAVAMQQRVITFPGSDHKSIEVTYKGEATVIPDDKVAKATTVTQASLQNNQPQAPAPTPSPTPSPGQPRDDTGSGDAQTDDPTCDEGKNILTGTNLQAMFDFAEAQIGKRYVMGDGNPNNNTFDCSELTQLAFAKAGVKLPRIAMAQYTATKKYAVKRSDLRPGDLLFFATIPGGVLVDHVGIYKGDNKILHAPNPRKRVGVYDLGDDDGYYWPKFVGASRPIRTVVATAPDTSTGGWGFPLKKHYAITSPYMVGRVNPATGVVNLHDGTDYGAPAGTPILAIADGRVTSAGPNGGYGNYVTVSHMGGKVISGYAHMSRVAVHKGQPVKKGQILGYVGETGNATGPHLHANVRVKGHNGDCGNGHCDWVNFNKFIKNTGGIRDKLLGTSNDFRSVAA